MALIPFSPEHLRVRDALPFGVRDASGQLLLAGGAVIETAERLQQLRGQKLYVDERESEAWRRSLLGAMDQMLRQNRTLEQIAQARPELARRPAGADTSRDESLPAAWLHQRMLADMVLSESNPAPAWLARLKTLAERTRALAARSPDAALYLLVQTAQHEVAQYSRHHALLCAVVCELVAQTLEWPAAEIDTLVLAALSMNVSITQLQDQLAMQEVPLSQAQRDTLKGHPVASAAMLQRAGVADALWLDTVRWHHDAVGDGQPLAALPAAARLARLLKRVDIFTAKLSRRSARIGMTPTQAARDACLGADGQPDEVGGAVLKSLGLYPPGTYVKLVSGETGVVLGRGRRANLPFVAALTNAAGVPLGEPLARDAIERRYAVECALRSDAVKVRLNDERLLKLAQARRRV